MKLDRLSRTFLCRKLSVSRLMHVLSITNAIECAAGSELISMGDRCNGMYVVLSGCFRIVEDDILEAELAPGECFGETSLIEPTRAAASLIAAEPSRVLLIGRKDFNRLTRRLPRLGNALLRNLARHLSGRITTADLNKPINLDDTGPMT